MSSHRMQRVGGLLKQEISDVIRLKIKDPRLGFVTVTFVEVSQDLRHAKVYISSPGTNEELSGHIGILSNAAGFIRSELFKRLTLKLIPELLFRADRSAQHGIRISQVLRKLEQERHRRES